MTTPDRAENPDAEKPVEVQEVLDTPDGVEPAAEPSEQPSLPDFNP
jgi:hypothetical protein